MDGLVVATGSGVFRVPARVLHLEIDTFVSYIDVRRVTRMEMSCITLSFEDNLIWKFRKLIYFQFHVSTSPNDRRNKNTANCPPVIPLNVNVVCRAFIKFTFFNFLITFHHFEIINSPVFCIVDAPFKFNIPQEYYLGGAAGYFEYP